MKIRLLEICSAGAAGAVVDIPGEQAEELIAHCSAEIVKQPKQTAEKVSSTGRGGRGAK